MPRGYFQSNVPPRLVPVETFPRCFPEQTFLDGLLARQKLGPVRHLRGVLELAQHEALEALHPAFRSANNRYDWPRRSRRLPKQHDRYRGSCRVATLSFSSPCTAVGVCDR